MREPPAIAMLEDGKRLHLQHGPIDLIVEAHGADDARAAAYDAASKRFVHVLGELCNELPLLRLRPGPGDGAPQGPVARRMWAAVMPFAGTQFITPMAAVAGSVADEILAVMRSAAPLDKAYANNGGDIAVFVAPGASFTLGLIDRPDRAHTPQMFGRVKIDAASGIGGIATSGWRGRSFSLGIADAATVLGVNAASADAAATLIGNGVDLPGHPAITRVPANDIHPDSDLDARLVTRAVGTLSGTEIESALARGIEVSERLLKAHLIIAAALHLAGQTVTIGAQKQFSITKGDAQEGLVHAG